jgi:tetratricopeptide (TPR) repeat protein
MLSALDRMNSESFQIDEFYLDLQEDGHNINPIDERQMEEAPYPGLRPYRTSEYPIFFGREGQADRLISILKKKRFLAVLGSSGTGKSSLVRAGMLPQLHGGYLYNAGFDWDIAICRPGIDPVRNLAISLSSVKCNSAKREDVLENLDDIEATLSENSYGILECHKNINNAKRSEKKNLLVIVDQFEELFRYKRESRELNKINISNHFVNLLLKAVSHSDGNIYVVITMRSEFLGDCIQFRDLPEFINGGQYLIPRLTPEELNDVITGPMRLIEKKIAKVLVNRLVNDVGDNIDQLPILQHALMRTYDNWLENSEAEEISHEHYEAIGEMENALARHADEVFAKLGDEAHPNIFTKDQSIVEVIFKCLTDRSSDDRGIRRPCKLKTIYGIARQINATPSDVNRVVDHFRTPGTSFIMPPINVRLFEELTIDISHESLMRNWHRLTKWIDEEVIAGKLYKILNERRELNEQSKSGWIAGGLLFDIVTWRDSYPINSTWASRYHLIKDSDNGAELHESIFRKNIDFLKGSQSGELLARQISAKRIADDLERTENEKRRKFRNSMNVLALLFFVLLTSWALFEKTMANISRINAETNLLELKLTNLEWYLPLEEELKTYVKDTLQLLRGKDTVELVESFKRAHDGLQEQNVSIAYFLLDDVLAEQNNKVTRDAWNKFIGNKLTIKHKLTSPKGVRVLRFLEGDEKFIAGASNGFYRFDLKSPRSKPDTIQPFEAYENPIAISHKGDVLVTYYDDRDVIVLYDHRNSTSTKRTIPSRLSVEATPTAFFTPDDESFAIVYENSVDFYDLNLVELSHKTFSRLSEISALHFDMASRQYFVSDNKGTVLSESLAKSDANNSSTEKNFSGKDRIKRIINSAAPFTRFEISPDGKTAFSVIQVGEKSRIIRVWRDSTKLCEFGWQHNVEGITFSRDGHWILSANDTSIYYWAIDAKPLTTAEFKKEIDSVVVRDYLLNRGIDAFMENDYAGAIEDFGSAIRYAPRYLLCYEWLAYGFRMQMDFRTSARILRSALALNQTPAHSVWNQLGLIYQDKGQYDSALFCFNTALETEPESDYLLYNIGETYARNEEFDMAIEYFQKAIERNQQQAFYWKGLGQLYVEMKDFEKGLSCYKRGLQQDGSSELLLTGVAALYYHQGNLRRAIAFSDSVLRIYDNYIASHSDMGFYMNQSGKYNAALDHLDRAIELDSMHFASFAHRGFTYLKLSDFVRAARDLNRSQRIDSTFAMTEYYWACYYGLKGNTAEAIRNLKLARAKRFRWAGLLENERSLDVIRTEPEFVKMLLALKKTK